MKEIKEKNIYNWVINSLEETTNPSFISTELLFKDFCETYNMQYDKTNLLSFSIRLSKILKNLGWKIKKSRVKAIRGYTCIKFRYTIKKTYLQSLSDLEKKFNQEAETIRQLILNKSI